VGSRLRAYFSRAWWALALSGGLLVLTVALAVWWGVAGDDAPPYVEPLTVLCVTGVALLELVRPGRKPEP
jgi:peptidoglycan/LPS O-acetylase OafA/YrhL